MFDTLCLRGLASAETRKEIAPPELITGQETIELSSRFVFIACMPLLPLIATDSPRTPHHLLNIDPTKASERINFLYGKLRLIWNCFESSELIHIFGFDLLGNSAWAEAMIDSYPESRTKLKRSLEILRDTYEIKKKRKF